MPAREQGVRSGQRIQLHSQANFRSEGGESIMQTTPNSISWFMLSPEPVNSDLPITYSLSRGNKEKQLPWCDILPSLQSHLHLRLC